MRIDRILAINLRKQGKSYNEISNELGIPKSTLSGWFKDNEWSGRIKDELTKKAQVLAAPKLRLMSLANKQRWELWHKECRQKAVNEFPDLKDNLLFVAGLMLYWGEGDKIIKNGRVCLANSDPNLIKIFYSFLKEVLLLPKNKVYIRLIIYPDLNKQSVENYWIKTLGIPRSQFKKTTIIQGRHPEKRLSYGIAYVEVLSRELKEKIFTWIDLYKTHFSQKPHMI